MPGRSEGFRIVEWIVEKEALVSYAGTKGPARFDDTVICVWIYGLGGYNDGCCVNHNKLDSRLSIG